MWEFKVVVLEIFPVLLGFLIWLNEKNGNPYINRLILWIQHQDIIITQQHTCNPRDQDHQWVQENSKTMEIMRLRNFKIIGLQNWNIPQYRLMIRTSTGNLNHSVWVGLIMATSPPTQKLTIGTKLIHKVLVVPRIGIAPKIPFYFTLHWHSELAL